VLLRSVRIHRPSQGTYINPRASASLRAGNPLYRRVIQGFSCSPILEANRGVGYSWKKVNSSEGLMYLEYVCVPGGTSLRMFSAAKMVNAYAKGVRETVERNK